MTLPLIEDQPGTLPSKLRPRLSCDGVIAKNKHLCWTPAQSWEMDQLKVCQICQSKNFSLFVEIAAKRDDRNMKRNQCRFYAV